MDDFLKQLFDTSGFPPRWYCGKWTAAHGWLHILADLGVWSAYVAIPCVLIFFIWRRRDLPFRTIFWLFGAFILACGTTHLMEALIFWWPAYRLAGAIKVFTAVVSWTTVFALVPTTPRVLAMRSPEELEREVEQRKNAEARLRSSLEEKQTLLREIHHRVKNNLQVISSLLDLQSQLATDPATAGIFRESQNRVRSMALVHERLYQSETLANIDFADYLRNLVAQLRNTFQGDDRRIRFELDLAPVRLSIDAAVPAGLAVNELITNSLKYAFPEQRSGVVTVRLAAADGQVVLTVQDDGIGLPAAVTLSAAKTLGLRLVAALVDQMHGTARLERHGGTTVQLTFPAIPSKTVKEQPA